VRLWSRLVVRAAGGGNQGEQGEEGEARAHAATLGLPGIRSAYPARVPGCLFCAIVAGEIPSERVAEDERTVAFMDINPATDGHCLVVPRAHAVDIHDLDPQDAAACARTAQMLAARAVAALGAEGVNVWQSSGRAAGQEVMHYHVHVIPRYAGDGVRLPWTPAPGEPGAITRAAAALRG
jgi:histidine triad (HIT) family protein